MSALAFAREVANFLFASISAVLYEVCNDIAPWDNKVRCHANEAGLNRCRRGVIDCTVAYPYGESYGY